MKNILKNPVIAKLFRYYSLWENRLKPPSHRCDNLNQNETNQWDSGFSEIHHTRRSCSPRQISLESE